MDLPVAIDQIGRLLSDHGRRARALVAVDSQPARLILLTDNREGGVAIDEFKLLRIERAGYGTKQYIFTVAESPDSIVLAPSSCACGAGSVAYVDPTPGYVRRMVRTPEYLTA